MNVGKEKLEQAEHTTNTSWIVSKEQAIFAVVVELQVVGSCICFHAWDTSRAPSWQHIQVPAHLMTSALTLPGSAGRWSSPLWLPVACCISFLPRVTKAGRAGNGRKGERVGPGSNYLKRWILWLMSVSRKQHQFSALCQMSSKQNRHTSLTLIIKHSIWGLVSPRSWRIIANE